mgnify:CR=1 FL=1
MGTKQKIWSLLVLLVFSVSTLAQDLSGFKNRFQFVRDDQGQLELVKDSSIRMAFSIRPYLEFIKDSLQREQALMKSKGDYDQRIRNLFDRENENFLGYGDQKQDGQAQIVVDSLRALENVDFDKVFSDPKFNDVMAKFEFKLRDALNQLDPTVMAHVQNPRFFYQKRVTYQVLTWGLNFAKKRLSQLPILNTASYVLVRVEELVRQRRNFHQNMLLHYLEQVPEDQLGLSHEEVNHIMSSIYESRIPWYAFWESNAAVANWDQFGTNKFFTDIRTYNNRFRRMSSTFDQVGKRLNYAFQDVNREGEKVAVNLFNTQHMFSRDLSVAYNYDNPGKTVRTRMVVQLAELGLSFVPLPSFIKGLAEDFLQSFYKQQVLIEGALYGHFEINGDQDALRMMKIQILNPFETL